MSISPTGFLGRDTKKSWQGDEEFDKPTYIRTLKRLSTLHVDCILSGHHIPYLREGSRLVGRAYAKALIEWR